MSWGTGVVATIIDVARHAGVATSTVSHVLNGTRFVSAQTTRAVQQAVLAVGYTPNTLARSLARSTTNTVGLAVSPSTNRYFADVINAIEGECAKLGMMVLLGNTHDEPGRERAVVAELHRRRVDGIILATSGDPEHSAVAYLREARIPSVLVDRLPVSDFDGVGVENRKSLKAMVDHLVQHGHRRIGLLTGQADFTTARERVDGFWTGIRAHGLDIPADFVSMGHTDMASARDAVAGLLSRADPVTALIGGNNLTTIGIMAGIKSKGLTVPRDVAVVGFDDFEWADVFEPRLTAMVQPCLEIGRRAASLLQNRIAAPHAPATVVRLDPTFVIRDSCGGRDFASSQTASRSFTAQRAASAQADQSRAVGENGAKRPV